MNSVDLKGYEDKDPKQFHYANNTCDNQIVCEANNKEFTENFENHHQGVVIDDVPFKSVKELTKHYLTLIENNSNGVEKNNSNERKISEFRLQLPNSGGGGSSPSSGISDDEPDSCNNFGRCGSYDSAMGHSEEEDKKDDLNYKFSSIGPFGNTGGSNNNNNNRSSIPCKTLLESQCLVVSVERKLSLNEYRKVEIAADADFRRKSFNSEKFNVWKTPSVVVSDYSDDVRSGLSSAQMKSEINTCSAESSLHNSWTSLNCYEFEYLCEPYRQWSSSTCSSLSGDEDGDDSAETSSRYKSEEVDKSPSIKQSLSRSASSESTDGNARQGGYGPFRRSTSPGSPTVPHPGSRRCSASGYEQYQKSLLEVPFNTDYGDPSSDDLSSEWESEREEPQHAKHKSSGWRKLRNIWWTPFFQTYKKHRYPWVQLAGHQGNFKSGPDQGTILKKRCSKEEACFQALMDDELRPYVPEYKGIISSNESDSEYIQLEDLLGDFESPCVMDCKIGVRTYLEEELEKAKDKPKLRKDMYDKMCQVDKDAPTQEEHKLKGVTKPRYMVWRETISSTATLGFRIEGIRNATGTTCKDFKTTKTKEQILLAFQQFTKGFPHAVPTYIQRLKSIKETLMQSRFFETHEVIGSSLLFVHDKYTANIWLIDFAKTVRLPDGVRISHDTKWKLGNHEDGYLIGIENLIKLFMTVLENQPATVTPPLLLDDPHIIDS